MATPEELTRAAKNCPCGQPPTLDTNPGGAFYTEGAIYWHKATGKEFCSPHCSLRWHETFWRRFCAHTGRNLTTGEKNGR